MLQFLAFPLLLIGGLWLPGWLFGRLLRLPPTLGGAVLGSAAVLMNLLLLLDVGGLRLNLGQVGGSLALLCGIAAWLLWRRDRPEPVIPAAMLRLRDQFDPYWIPAGLGLLAITLRAVLDPLSGFDTGFRWDFLAQQMFRTGTLAFYPAISTGDFLNYAWCDGFAPLVSSLYFWSYLSLGSIAGWATAPVVMVVAALLFHAIGELAAPGAKSRARALAATSALLLWGIAMGQETGLTALTLCLMFVSLDRHQTTRNRGWLIWAGLAAGTGALTREYGLVYPALGVFALGWHRAPRSAWWPFLITAGAVASPWYLRNWLKTGNPVWPHELAGLFPGNAVQTAYYRVVGELQGHSTGLSAFAGAWPILLWTAALPLALGLFAGGRDWRRQAPLLVAIIAVVALWIWSIGMTSGGLNYSLRVLTPVVALTAALGARLTLFPGSPRLRLLLLALLGLAALDAGARSLYLPWNTSAPWWREPPMAWRNFGLATAQYAADPQWTRMARVADGQISLVFHPADHGILTRLGTPALPLFTPEFSFLFAPTADFPAAVRQLRQKGVRFIILSNHDPFQDRMLAPHPFFQVLATKPPALSNQNYLLYDVFNLSADHRADATPP
ncbi:MAG: hypothetical protein PSW75_12235 [bacterium]|nr:hypothetical protein [bacterium]MDI1335991.1 hypothetical protein [Lacunisphaera sp.]